METRAAVIDNGVVSNIIVIDPNDKEVLNKLNAVIIPDGVRVNIGWSYDGAQFIAPPRPPLTLKQNIAAIKAKARRIILARFPEYKQRNYLKREIELRSKLVSGETLTSEEQAELDFITAEWQWVKAVREISNAAEAAGTPVDEIIWPE